MNKYSIFQSSNKLNVFFKSDIEKWVVIGNLAPPHTYHAVKKDLPLQISSAFALMSNLNVSSQTFRFD